MRKELLAIPWVWYNGKTDSNLPNCTISLHEALIDLFNVSYGELNVRFIGDGIADEVVTGGGGTPIRFYHGCDTITWWSQESGKPAGFSYFVFGPFDTTHHEINDIMIKFGTVYKEVHF